MLHLLYSIQDVMSSDPALVERLSYTAFVTTNAALAASAALYDPRNEELVALLDADRHFPSGPFRKDDKVLLCPSSHICRILVVLCSSCLVHISTPRIAFGPGAGCAQSSGAEKHHEPRDAAGCSPLS